MKIVTTEEMRRIEQETDAGGHSYAAMMDMAGRAVAQSASTLVLQGMAAPVLVLVGPGNNGGDGLVAARYLLDLGCTVTVYVWKRDIRGDQNFRKLKQRRRGIAILWSDNDAEWTKLRQEIQGTGLIIDALLGTGATRPIEGKLAELLSVVHAELAARRHPPQPEPAPDALAVPRLPLLEAWAFGDTPADGEGPGDLVDELDEDLKDDLWPERTAFADNEDAFLADLGLPELPWPQPPVLAVDCPSGLNCDTGAIDPAALEANLTVTFAFPKWGQLQFPGAGACGLLAVADIGVPAGLADGIQTQLIEPAEISRRLPARPIDAHKGSFGKAMIVAGSLDYTGAAYLSAAAAMRGGAGLVTLAIPASLHAALAGVLPEVTWLLLPEAGGTHAGDGVTALLSRLRGYGALLVGPGLTSSDGARALVDGLFAEGGIEREAWRGRTVVDADALNILSTSPGWPSRLPPESILTPHPGEMARLTGQPAADINARRIATARRYAAEWGHVVLLKGAHTVIAGPDGRAVVIPFALPTLATAGSGDALAGAIVAMLAQGLPPFEAAICGAYLHGHAGLLLMRETGSAGSTASDIIELFPEALRQLRGER